MLRNVARETAEWGTVCGKTPADGGGHEEGRKHSGTLTPLPDHTVKFTSNVNIACIAINYNSSCLVPSYLEPRNMTIIVYSTGALQSKSNSESLLLQSGSLDRRISKYNSSSVAAIPVTSNLLTSETGPPGQMASPADNPPVHCTTCHTSAYRNIPLKSVMLMHVPIHT